MTYNPTGFHSLLTLDSIPGARCDEGVSMVLRPLTHAYMGYLRHEQLQRVYLPTIVEYLVPGSLEAESRGMFGGQVLLPEGAKGRRSKIPMDVIVPLDTRWAEPCSQTTDHKHTPAKDTQGVYCSRCGVSAKLVLLRTDGPFLEIPPCQDQGAVIACAIGDKATQTKLREGEDIRYTTMLRHERWKKYVKDGMEGRGERNWVDWTPDALQHGDEVWIDLGEQLATHTDTPEEPVCRTWIEGSGKAPPAYLWSNILKLIVDEAAKAWSAHPAVVLDLRSLVRALIEHPLSRGRFGSDERDVMIDTPGELLRCLRNAHYELRGEEHQTPGVLVALPRVDTWSADLEGRSGLASGRRLWSSGR